MTQFSGGPVTITAHKSTGETVYSKVIQCARANNKEKIKGKLVFYSKYPIMFLQRIDAADYLNFAKSTDNLYFVYGKADEVDRFVLTIYTDDYR